MNRAGEDAVGRVVNRGQADDPFPLTPALSLGEREARVSTRFKVPMHARSETRLSINRGLEDAGGCFVNGGPANDSFPLTTALSLGERETRVSTRFKVQCMREAKRGSLRENFVLPPKLFVRELSNAVATPKAVLGSKALSPKTRRNESKRHRRSALSAQLHN
jgi:hypothetical protein